MTTTQQRNGVNVEQLTQTMDHIKQQPGLADFKFRAHTEWQQGAKSRTSITSLYGAGQEHGESGRQFNLEGDEPDVLLGSDSAPNAVETVLHALTSCLTVGFIYNAAAKGIEVRALDFDVEGNLDLQGFLGLSDDSRPGYKNITVRYRVDSDAPREDLESLCEYVQKTSPVVDMLRNPVPVDIELVS